MNTGFSKILKFLISAAIVMALFFVVSMPQTYGVTNSLFNMIGAPTIVNGQPTVFGVLLHGLVLYVITVLIMKFVDPKEKFYKSIKRSV